jgi:hypothetical protein
MLTLVTVTTLKDIQLRIAEEELISTEDGVEVEQESMPSTFIMMGLTIEDIQCVSTDVGEWNTDIEARWCLEIDVKALQSPTASQKRRTALLKKIYKFRQLQLVYMPALRCFLSDHEKQVLDGNGDQMAETTRLFMPSEMADSAVRKRACAVGLPKVEERMWEGEAMEALEVVRQGLRTRTMTNRFKIRNHTGQGVLTWAKGFCDKST